MSRIVALVLATMPMTGICAAPSIAEDAGPAAVRLSPWMKLCLKGQGPDATETCLTGRDAQTACGPVGAAVVIEREGEVIKTLRVTLPRSVSQQAGARITIDRGETISRPYTACYPHGCLADYVGDAELIALLKQRQTLLIEGLDGAGRPIAVALPLAGFAQVYDGPPTDPQVFEAQQKRIEEEILRPDQRFAPAEFEKWRRDHDERNRLAAKQREDARKLAGCDPQQ